MMLYPDFTRMADVIPEGKEGCAKISHLQVTAEASDMTRMRAVLKGDFDQIVREGSYVQLHVKGRLMMSDTQMEQQSNRTFIQHAKGDVLIAGLGVGLILLPILPREEVTSVTVIEKYPDVIRLVEPHVRKAAGSHAAKLTVIEANIFEWKPLRGSRYDRIYFDIWPNVCTDNLDQINRLHRKFGRYCKGQMVSWMQDKLRRRRRKEKKERKTWVGWSRVLREEPE